MTNVLKRFRWLSLIVQASVLVACSGLTPQENFKSFRQQNVGKSIDDPTSEVALYPQLLVGKKMLPSGNWEYEYQWYGACRYYYEIDSKTRLIVGWRSEGSEHDCQIPN